MPLVLNRTSCVIGKVLNWLYYDCNTDIEGQYTEVEALYERVGKLLNEGSLVDTIEYGETAHCFVLFPQL